MSLLTLDDVTVKYGAIEALKGVSLTVEQGEVVTLLGANGAGKTTTLRTISGLLRPSLGRVLFEGKPLGQIAAHDIVALGIGHVPEGRRVFPVMSVTENLEMGAYQRKGGNKAMMKHVFELFPRLEERKDQDAGTLSGGEQQMLAIGRAMMSGPKLLLLDEPSMGLAPLIVAQIFDIIRAVNAEGTTCLLVEQNASQALKLANRGYVLETGNIVMSGPADTMLEDPRIRAAYLGEEIGAA